MRTKIDTIWCWFLFVWVLSFICLCGMHYAIFHSILISSLWKHPLVFWEFYIPRIMCSLGMALLVFPIGKKETLEVKDKSEVTNIIFLLSVVAQCFLFNKIVFHDWSFTFSSVMLKLSIAGFIAGWVCLIQKAYWQIVISILIDVLMVAEVMYYRANGFFLDGPTMLMADNLAGWWSSLKILITFSDLWLLLPTIVVVVGVILYPTKQRARGWAILMIAISFILNFFGCMSLQQNKYRTLISGKEMIEGGVIELNPFSEQAPIMLGVDMHGYIFELSVIHAFVYNIRELQTYFSDSNVKYTEEELQIISECFEDNQFSTTQPQTKLIICLIESFEDWVLTPEIMPNLSEFIQSHDHILYANSVESQVKIGTSADGQMIVNTGLLPIKRGAACFRYPHNEYPALSRLYTSTCGIFPHPLSVWNQSQMSKAYHIDSNYVISHSDKVIFSNVLQKASSFDYVLAITSSTHNPFETICDSSDLQLDEKMPSVMARYIKSFNYFDKGLAILLDSVNKDSNLQNTTIVITADHKIFQNDLRKEFMDYTNHTNAGFTVERPFIPLVIYSPNIEGRKIITEPCYQMDIYPTILSAIGCKDHTNNAMGVDLMRIGIGGGKNAIRRTISAEQALNLSDKLIRDNYFKTKL